MHRSTLDCRRMALPLCSNSMPSLSCACVLSTSSSNGSSSLFLTTKPISRLSPKPVTLVGVCVLPPIAAKKRSHLIVKASSDVLDSNDVQPESDDEDFPMDELALDAKLQTKLEKKLRMKIAKKIRLRRKKLVHKRRLRKKGRWPPSKMKKLSNV